MTDPRTAPPDLHDIVLSDPVSWAPQTAGWWVVLGLFVLALTWTVHALVRRRRANRYRKLALARLTQIEQSLADPSTRANALTALPVLVKRTALAFRPRTEVGALSGDPWLRFLDTSYGGNGFTAGVGRLLPTLAYSKVTANDGPTTDEVHALIDLVRRWIRRHRVRV